MKSCPKCQSAVSDSAKFCVKCGFNIKKYEEDAEKEYFCAECGTKFSGGTFCPECGYNIEAEATGDDNLIFTTDEKIKLSLMQSQAVSQLYAQNGFSVDNGVLTEYFGKKRSIVIPSTIEEIYDMAFENNKVITFVEIEEGVSIIGKKAFSGCSSLVKINIPASCKRIYDDTFEGTKLEELVLTKYDEYVYKNIVKYCLSKEAADIFTNNPDHYLIKGDNYVIVNIEAVELDADKVRSQRQAERKEHEKKLKEEENKKREANKDLEQFEIEDGILHKYKGKERIISIPECVTIIAPQAFANSNIICVTIPKSVTMIGGYAFKNCLNLTRVEILSGVETIGEEAFAYCGNLMEINLGDSLTTIGRFAFRECNNLTTLELPDSVRNIGEYAFYGCSGLTSLEVPDCTTSIGNAVFCCCVNLVTVKIPKDCKLGKTLVDINSRTEVIFY